LENFDIVHDSPSQIYHSALPFCPTSSWLHKHYNAELSQEVQVVKGLPAEWGVCSRTVTFDELPQSLAHYKDIIAAGLFHGDIIILNGVTGSQAAILSRHTKWVESLTFSLDGALLVSGSGDTTINLWDVQTGGVVKTFCGHTNYVFSVSISSDCTTIASGSHDMTIRLWDVKKGECFCIIEQSEKVSCVDISPSNPQLLISATQGGIVQQWDLTGHKSGPEYKGSYVVFCPDGTYFVSWGRKDITVWNSESGEIVAEFHLAATKIFDCCFSPDGRLVAAAADDTVYVWDIMGSDPNPIKTFDGHLEDLISLTFSSSIISSSWDKSIKFWQFGASPADQGITGPNSTLTSTAIQAVTLQTEHGIVTSCGSGGVVKTWDIPTGVCSASIQTPAEGFKYQDAQLTNSGLVNVWWADKEIHIWDVEKGELLHKVDIPGQDFVTGIRISGDGSKVFCLGRKFIRAWSIWTGEITGEVEWGGFMGTILTVEGSKVWVYSEKTETDGWDFGTPGPSPVLLSNVTQERHRLHFIDGTKGISSLSTIEDTVTGKVVFQLPARFSELHNAQWDGQHLVGNYESGELLILDFNHVLPQ